MPESREHASPGLAGHFESFEQQHHASTLGMWLFLGSELMLFGAMFLGYTVYRIFYGEAFARMSEHLSLWLGTINTALLLTSSATMAMAVHAARHKALKKCRLWLLPTAALGAVFLGIKFYEWYLEYAENLVPIAGLHFDAHGAEPGPARLFMGFYFVMTGLHALHLSIGVALVLGLIALLGRDKIPRENPDKIEIIGLYWHLVDIIWIFAYPIFYLASA
jgi:cytochrome c oxidase subunit 3